MGPSAQGCITCCQPRTCTFHSLRYSPTVSLASQQLLRTQTLYHIVPSIRTPAFTKIGSLLLLAHFVSRKIHLEQWQHPCEPQIQTWGSCSLCNRTPTHRTGPYTEPRLGNIRTETERIGQGNHSEQIVLSDLMGNRLDPGSW